MKRILLISSICLLSFTALYAQGIQFEHGSWKEVVKKAKKERKLIFADFYAVWCGPCKMMSAQVFTQQQVGSRFNGAFVNFKVDAEKGEGVGLAEQFGIRAYPTCHFIDPVTEKVVHTIVGAMPPDALLAEANIALKKQKKKGQRLATAK